MKQKIILLIGLTVLTLTGCAQAARPTTLATLPATVTVAATPTQAPSPTPAASATLAPSATPLPSPTPSYPPAGLGPAGWPAGVDPLTGLPAASSALLQRRPMVIKVENLPRDHRPQSGLSLADLVYEYYTEQGGTRFAAIFYGTDAERVGPIRSGRFFDINLVQAYKGVFAFGSAYEGVWNRIVNSDFANRLVLENDFSCPALCRYEPEGANLLVANTAKMGDYLKVRAIDNSPQNLDGMFFQLQPPAGGVEGKQAFIRYSGAIYNRWDYDPASGRYLRFVDKQNDLERNNEVYVQHTDALTSKPIAADTVVTLCVPHEYVVKTAEIDVVDIWMNGQAAPVTSCDGNRYEGGKGPAYVFRDGKMFKVTWSRVKSTDLLTLIGEDGNPFPFKPGQTWFEVIGASSKVEQKADGAWRFTFVIAP